MNSWAVVIERSYRATPEELWALWTTKHGFESWWGPEGFRVDVHAIEPWPGGKLDYDMIADAPEMIAFMQKEGMGISHGTHGSFTLVEPYARLQLTHVIDFLPGVAPYRNNILVEFVPDQAEVRMIVQVERHPSDEWTNRSVEGFTSQLTKLPGALERLRGSD